MVRWAVRAVICAQCGRGCPARIACRCPGCHLQLPPALASTRKSSNPLAALPWSAIVITLLVAVAAAFPHDALRDAATFGPVAEVRLLRPTAYVALAPLSDVLDTLTLLSVPQHIGVLVDLLVLYALWRGWRVFRNRRGGEPLRARRELGGLGLFLLVIVAVYAFGAMATRPMAQLVADDPTVVSIDFHSHTEFSHDGRSGWSPEDVRAWHQEGGYDVAYISDHRTLEGAQRAIASNPARGGEGTILLPALEVGWRGAHVNILSAGSRYRGLYGSDLRDMDEEALTMASVLAGAEPIIVHTVPGDLSQLTPAKGPGTAGARAIEVVDGAPRGLTQSRAQRAQIVELARDNNLAMVAGTDNHGWGRTAPAWTLMRITNWRGGAAAPLAEAIEGGIRSGGFESTRVVERVVADPGRAWAALALPIAAWSMFTTITIEERVAWMIWTWAVVLLVAMLRRRRARA